MKAIGTILLAAGLAAVASAQDQDKELEKLQGTWKIQSAKVGKSDYDAKTLSAQTINFAGDTITCKEIKGGSGKAVIDTAKKPPTVSCQDKKGKVVREFVYQVEDDTLKVIFYPTGTKMAADSFDKPPVDLMVITYKREKK
jgi:uncharacterized protein (TIGR03067 family)